ncbi:hypothetical protein GGTG_11461 [Gaeumannomyces tritici R3-111a-1]|uniref:Uncharacterized protein n=1 Tax=Gaeumannomyces tritici (strain R3-111a-1) TaxID=644352 RepID=J3PD92_GAET3|nr:hypothetical protein GGTG_11461 [Gaeumannomyces tritici R3-111a-1]EJT70437.1 hypothetical protein GGTG_11461 [Gaeumannomyces tritici R3-111a-1]
MATAENGAAPALGTVPAELMNLVPPTEKIGEVGRISHPYDSIYFTCPPERKYILSKAHDEADGIVYKPRPLSLDGHGLQPFSQGALGFHSNEEIWHKANEYRQCHPLEAAQVRTDPQTYEDLYDYFDGYDLYFLGVHNALNVIKALVQQNKLLDPFIQQDKRKEMNEFLDEWMAADPEAEKRLLSWDWEVDPSARAVLDGSDMVAKLGHMEEEDKLLFSTLIASRCEQAQLAREALRPMVVDGSSDGSLGADRMLCHDGDSGEFSDQPSLLVVPGREVVQHMPSYFANVRNLANAGAPIPLPDGTAGPLPSAPFGAQMPMMATAQMPIVPTAEMHMMPAVEAPMATTATSVSAPKYAFNGKMSTKLSRPAQSSQNNLSTDCKHPSAASISPQRLRMKLRLRPGNTQMAHGPSIGRPEFGYHGGHHPEATPTKPPRHGPMQGPQGQMLGGPFYGQGHVGFNNQDLNNRAWMPHGRLPQPGVLQQPVGHQGGTGREFSTASMPMPAPSPNQGLQTIGCHGDVHLRTAPNYQQASPPRFQMPGQLQQVSPPRFQMPDQLQQASPPHGRVPGHPQQTPSTRFTDSQRRASGSGPSTKNCPPGNGAGWALSEQQDSIHGQKFVYNKTNTSDGPKNRRNNTLGNQSLSNRKQQAGNDKPAAAAAATAHQDTKHPNKNGGGNGYVRPPPPTKETCRNWDRSNRLPSVECPCPTCLQRSRNITVAVMGGGFLDRSDEGALRKHFCQWGQIETVIFPRPAPGFQNGFQGQRPTSRVYITYVFQPFQLASLNPIVLLCIASNSADQRPLKFRYTSDTVPPVVVEEANGQLCPGVRGALRVLHPQNSKYFTGVKTSPRHPSHGGRPAVSGPAPQYHQPGLPSLAGILSPPLESSNLAIGGGSIGSHPRPLPMPPMVPTGLNQGLPQYPQLNNSVRQIGEHLALTGPASLPALPPRPGVPMLPAPGFPESATTPTAAQHEEKPTETSEAQQPRENQDEADEQSQPSEKPQESGEAQETGHPPSSDAHDNLAEQGDRKASPPGMHRGLSVIISEDKVATPSLSTGNSTIIMTPAGSDKSNDSNTQPASQLEVPPFAEENSGTVVVHRRGKPHGSIPKEWRTDTSAAESNHADGYMGDSEAAKSSMKPSDGGHDKEGDKVKPASKKKGNNKKPKNKTQEAGKNPQGGQNAHDGQGMSATDGSAAGNGAAGCKKVAANKKNKSGKFAKRGHQEDLTSEGARTESRAATTISSGRSTPAFPHRADEPQGDKAQGKKKRKQQQQQQWAPTPTPEPESNKTDDAVISKAQTPEKGGDEGDAQDDLLVRKNRGGGGDLLSISPFAAQKYEIDRLHAGGDGGGGGGSSAREPSSSSSTLRAKSWNKASGAASLAAAGTADGDSKPRHMVRGGSTLPRGFDPYPRIPTVAAVPRTAATPSSTGDKATAAEPALAAKGKAVEGGADEAKPAAQQPPSQAKNTPPTTPVSSPKASDAAAIARNDDALPPSPPSSVKCQAAALNPTAKPFVLSSPVGPSDGGKKKKNRKQSNKGGDKGGSVAAAAAPQKQQRGRNFMGMRLSGFSNYGTLASGFDAGNVWEERGGEQQQRQQIADHQIYKFNHKEAQVAPSSGSGVTTGIDKYLGSAAGGGDNSGEDDKGETEMPAAVDHDTAAQQEEQLGQPLLPEQQKQQQSDQDNEQQQQEGEQQDGQGIATAERDGAYETAAAKMADWQQQQHKTRAPSGGSAKARPAPGAESGEHHSRPHQRTGSGRSSNKNKTTTARPQQQQARNPPISPASSTTLSTGSGSGSGSKSATATAMAHGGGSMKGSVGGGPLRPDSLPAAAAAPAKPAVRVHSSIELAKALKNHKARISSSGGSKA